MRTATEEDCEPSNKLYCNSIGCPDGYTPIDNAKDVECEDDPCEVSQCCEAFCSYYACPDKCIPVTGADTILCDDSGCTTELCCDCGEHNQTLNEYLTLVSTRSTGWTCVFPRPRMIVTLVTYMRTPIFRLASVYSARPRRPSISQKLCTAIRYVLLGTMALTSVHVSNDRLLNEVLILTYHYVVAIYILYVVCGQTDTLARELAVLPIPS